MQESTYIYIYKYIYTYIEREIDYFSSYQYIPYVTISMWIVASIQGTLEGYQKRSLSFLLRLFQSNIESLDSETLFQLRVGATAGFAPTTVTTESFVLPRWKLTFWTQKWRCGRWIAFSIGWFVGSILIFRGGFKGYRFSWGKVKQRSKEERTGRVLIQQKLGVPWRAKNGACLLNLMCFLRVQQLRPSSDFAFPTHDFHKRSLEEYHKLLQKHKEFLIISIVDQLGLQHIFQAYVRCLMVEKQIFAPQKKKTKPF